MTIRRESARGAESTWHFLKSSLGNHGHVRSEHGRTQQESYLNPYFFSSKTCISDFLRFSGTFFRWPGFQLLFLAPRPASVISYNFQVLTSDDPASNFLYFICNSKGGEVKNKSLMRSNLTTVGRFVYDKEREWYPVMTYRNQSAFEPLETDGAASYNFNDSYLWNISVLSSSPTENLYFST